MSPLFRVFVAATVGAVIATYVEPLITPKLPSSLATPTMAMVVNASIVGVSTIGIFYAIGGVKA